MHAIIYVSNSIIVLTLKKKMRIVELCSFDYLKELEIVYITIDIQLQNHNTNNPIPNDICIKLSYE